MDPIQELYLPVEELHSPGHIVDSFLRTTTPTQAVDSKAGAANSGTGAVAPARTPAPVADKVADNGGEPGEGTAASAPLWSLRS